MLSFTTDLRLDPSEPPTRKLKFIFFPLSIFTACLCVGGFVFTSIYWQINQFIVDQCTKDSEWLGICYVKFLFTNAMTTNWNKYLMISLLTLYATVFFQIIVESNRSNIVGLLGWTSLQTASLIFGIGAGFSLIFLVSYLHFYSSKNKHLKSPVPLQIIPLALIYVLLFIEIPTLLLYIYLSSNSSIVAIVSIILLISPIIFPLISLPFRLTNNFFQRCWLMNSHRLIIYSQSFFFVLSTCFTSISFALFVYEEPWQHLKTAYVNEQNEVNPVSIIWSIDYLCLLMGLGFFIIITEYSSPVNMTTRGTKSIKRIVIWFSFSLIIIVAPSIAFPLYIIVKEHRYADR